MSGLPLLLTGLLAASAAAAASCKAKDIKIPRQFGLEVLDVLATEVNGWQDYGMVPVSPMLPSEQKPLDFCNVTVTYTHPGLNDTIHVNVRPPKEAEWNNRFLGQGGGGWASCLSYQLGPAVSMGFAAADTDAGHNVHGELEDIALSSESWALTSPGNANLVLLQDFAYRGIDDMTRIAKEVVNAYYGKYAEYAYWNGCSTGGRQGLVAAQRYPEHYNGILAAAPAINWVTFVVSELWPQVVMKKVGYYPPACELHAITKAAIEACDGLDGVQDGIISAHGLCDFDATTVIGQTYDCEGDTRKISAKAAQVANAAWQGPVQNGEPIWHGLAYDTSLVGYDPVFRGLANTICDAGNKKCKSNPFDISADWIRHWVFKIPQFDTNLISEEIFFDVLRTSRLQYHSIMDSADPDLRKFQQAGGKLILWHGLADQLIAPNGSLNYYERVSAISPDVTDFFRYFEVPGVTHCFGGSGALPLHALNSLMDWVEKGIAPEKLDGSSLPMSEADVVRSRPICPYPQVAAYKSGDVNQASSFECAESFDAFGRTHDEL